MFMLQRMHALAVGAAETEAPPITANAVDFDGTNDYMLRGSGLTGASDSPLGIFSAWVRIDGGSGTRIIYAGGSDTIIYLSGSTLEISLSASGGFGFVVDSATTYTSGATWRHFLVSWNTNFAAGSKIKHLYVNDVSDVGSVSDGSGAFSVDYTAANHGVGAATDASGKWNGCMSEVYFAPGQFLDFSVSSNRRKFISALGKPVSLGSDGSLPTGVAPAIYLNNGAATFNTNKGTGGNFTITGTLDTASSSPSD